ncbi:MAG: NAD(P)-binding domain-containing protein, partial [Candidatus Omnitrophica bacterium]|nr:NAD(P)-binding domain-containing protein [Candidatus Omnitrophota bacterium]
MIDKKIGIIGCGNMGEAILSRLSNVLEKSVSIMVSEFDAKRRDYIQSKYRAIVEVDNNEVVKFADVIILAVKPKDLEGILKTEVCCGASKDKLLISIVAGITTKYIENIVGPDVPVIRIMPNMAATIGESISSISAGRNVTSKHMELAREIFLTIGDV